MSEQITDALGLALANTYTLFLKTQNYHWHVKGPQFKPCHELFETQYRALFEAIDSIAERILTLGGTAPATFQAFSKLTTLKEGHTGQNSNEMLKELATDHAKLIKTLQIVLNIAQTHHDEGTVALMGERIAEHEKQAWMLRASQNE